MPDEPAGRMTAQLSVLVPVSKPSGFSWYVPWPSFRQVVFGDIVLYHSAPVAWVSKGVDMGEAEPPAFHAWMNEVMSGCHAVCGNQTWLAYGAGGGSPSDSGQMLLM